MFRIALWDLNLEEQRFVIMCIFSQQNNKRNCFKKILPQINKNFNESFYAAKIMRCCAKSRSDWLRDTVIFLTDRAW